MLPGQWTSTMPILDGVSLADRFGGCAPQSAREWMTGMRTSVDGAGELGADGRVLTGGEGADVFVWNGGRDRITDFDRDDDTIDLSARRHELITRFCATATQAVLESYESEMRAWAQAYPDSAPLLPAEPETRRTLLDLALLEKAAYEIVYEAAHRPEWMPVPLRGLQRAAQRLLTPFKETDDTEPEQGES